VAPEKSFFSLFLALDVLQIVLAVTVPLSVAQLSFNLWVKFWKIKDNQKGNPEPVAWVFSSGNSNHRHVMLSPFSYPIDDIHPWEVCNACKHQFSVLDLSFLALSSSYQMGTCHYC
jgi:hypothetical protein